MASSSNKLPPIAERVAAGATALDAAAPGWAAGIDPLKLQVDLFTTRISLAKHLRDAYAVELTHTAGVAHGMCLSLADFDDPAHDPRPDQLDAWRAEITRRQQPNVGA